MRIFVAIAISFCMLASGAHGQTSKDQGAIRIMRSGSQPSRQGPAEYFTGSSWLDENGVTQEELIEIITHLTFYCG